MAKMVKKVKKKLGSRGGGGPSIKETSDLRPSYVEKTPPCGANCPNHNPIRKALTYIAQSEKYERSYEDSLMTALDMWFEKSPFPGVCGRVCPHPCEEGCNRSSVDEVISINAFERYLGDYAVEKGYEFKLIAGEDPKAEKVAVIGSGPAGMSCAYQLARRGYKVTVFEAFPKAGGMLRYGIPYYRLPEAVLDGEIQRILNLGVELKLNTIVGKDVAYDDLKKEYKAIFVGIGAHKGKLLGVEGENCQNVISGVEFLNKVNSGVAVDVGKNVLVVGGGNTAIDAARVSRRLGAEVTVVYRRTEKEMPAISEEIEDAKDEGIKFELLAAPTGFTTDGEEVSEMCCCRMELGEPDESGRCRPVPKEDDTFNMAASTVICAISQEPGFEGMENLREGRGWIKTDKWGAMAEEGVFAGGDDINLGLVIEAIAAGRKAGEAIDNYIQNKKNEDDPVLPKILHTDKFDDKGRGHQMFITFYEKKERTPVAHISVEERLGADGLTREVAATMSYDQVLEESKRCMSCGMCFKCDNCFQYCQDNAVVKPFDINEPFRFKMELCQGCKKCAENCPCGYIDLN